MSRKRDCETSAQKALSSRIIFKSLFHFEEPLSGNDNIILGKEENLAFCLLNPSVERKGLSLLRLEYVAHVQVGSGSEFLNHAAGGIRRVAIYYQKLPDQGRWVFQNPEAGKSNPQTGGTIKCRQQC